jgi:adenylate cyclase
MDDLLDVREPHCRECGTALRLSARFCDLCGTPVRGTRTTGERKHITVLFADVVQSMALAATLGPERLQEVMYDLFNGSAEAVQRYQGTVDKFTGDGLMAVFGAPLALEDHALRACLAAQDIQVVARSIAQKVRDRDRTELRLRVGLNSGEVIAGEMGSGPTSYTVIGHPVGMAQRIESVAEPGTVLCSERTARLAGPAAVFGLKRSVAVKGSNEPVAVRSLESIHSEDSFLARDDGPMVGRNSEIGSLVALLDSASAGMVYVVGEPGVGKSRLVREFTAEAVARGGRAVTVRCEAHTAQIPLHAATRLLRALFDINDLDDDGTRISIAEQLDESADIDVVLDFLARDDEAAAGPHGNADLRRRRLVEVMVQRAKGERPCTIYVVEDLHWIDAASDELIRIFAAALEGHGPLIVGTGRPDYDGPIRSLARNTIAISPLSEPEVTELLCALVGQHPRTYALTHRVAQASAGNPFFLEEIVRDLVDRGILTGPRGDYLLVHDETSIFVPATVQAVIAARIDRLSNDEKSILNAAAVIGSTFDADALDALVPLLNDAGIRALLAAELIDQTELLPIARYRFRHPLLRSVCYEAQLRTTRSASHRRHAHYLQSKRRQSDDHDAGLIAHHFEAADELVPAYTEFMRSAAWLFHRDVGAARDSWKRAAALADRIPSGEGVAEKRIAPRAQLCFTAWLVGGHPDEEDDFAELRRLTAGVDDALPLALAMAGRINSLVINQCRPRDAASLVAELEVLYDNVGGPDGDRSEILTTIALAHYSAGALDAALWWIDKLRTSELQLGPYFLTTAIAMSGVIKVLSGRRAEGRHDLAAARGLGLDSDPMNFAGAVAYSVDCVVLGFNLADEALLQETERALRLAEDYGDASGHAAYGLSLARWAHGTVLINGDWRRRAEGVALLELCRSAELDMTVGPVAAQLAAEYRDRGGIDDDAIGAIHARVLASLDSGNVCFVGYCAAELVKLFLARGRRGDLATAEGVVASLEAVLTELHQPAMDLWPLLCRTELAYASGNTAAFNEIQSRYRGLATRLDAVGHLVAIDEIGRRG